MAGDRSSPDNSTTGALSFRPWYAHIVQNSLIIKVGIHDAYNRCALRGHARHNAGHFTLLNLHEGPTRNLKQSILPGIITSWSLPEMQD